MLNYGQTEKVTDREVTEHLWEVEMFDKQAEHAVKIKELEIEASKLEARITSWFRIPLYILSIPVRILFVIPLCIYVLKKEEIPEHFWNLLK